MLDALPGPCKSNLDLSAEEFIRPAHWKLLLPNQFRLRCRLDQKSRLVVPRTILRTQAGRKYLRYAQTPRTRNPVAQAGCVYGIGPL